MRRLINIVENAQEYMTGECHVFAVAVHRALGYPFVLLVDEADAYAPGVPAVHHVYCDDGHGHLVDTRGAHDRTDVLAQWEATEHGEPSVLELDSEAELDKFCGEGWNVPLTSYSEQDVAAASEFATRAGIIPARA